MCTTGEGWYLLWEWTKSQDVLKVQERPLQEAGLQRDVLHFIGALCIEHQLRASPITPLPTPPAPGDETRTPQIEQSAKLSPGLKWFQLLLQVCSWWEAETPLGPQSWGEHWVRPDFQCFSRAIGLLIHFLCIVSNLSHAHLFLLVSYFTKQSSPCLVWFFHWGGVQDTEGNFGFQFQYLMFKDLLRALVVVDQGILGKMVKANV